MHFTIASASSNGRLWRRLSTGASILLIVVGCGSNQRSGPNSERTSALSTPGAGDQILLNRSCGTTNGIPNICFFENSSAVVPPGVNASCQNGRFFFAEGGSQVVSMVDLPCVEAGNCAPAAIDSNVFTRMTASLSLPGQWVPDVVDNPGTDNQFIRLSDYSVVHVRGGTKMKKGQVFGTIYMFRSTDCGTNWTVSSVDADGAFPDGHCGWPADSTDIGVYRPTTRQFILDGDGSGTVTPPPGGGDRVVKFDPIANNAGALPVVGAWKAEECAKRLYQGGGLFPAPCQRSNVGLFKDGTWYLDLDGDGAWNASTDMQTTFGSVGHTPIVGKWNAPDDNRDLIGTFNGGAVRLDTNGNYKDDGCDIDTCFTFGTVPLAQAVAWPSKLSGHQGRRSTVGFYNPNGSYWHLDDGNRVYNPCGTDLCPTFQTPANSKPVAGYWDGLETWSIGTFKEGVWQLDGRQSTGPSPGDNWNGNMQWDGCGSQDKCFTFGQAGDLPVVGQYRADGTGDNWNGFPGTWDRPEAYADPLDPRGMVYLSMHCNARRREAVIASSNNFGNQSSWKAWSIWGRNAWHGVPYMLGSTRSDMLYEFGLNGTSPELTPISVDTATNTLTMLPPWYVFQTGGAYSSLPDSSTWSDRAYGSALAAAGRLQGTNGVASIGRVAGVDHLYAMYPGKRSSTSNDQVLRVMEIDVTGGATISSVATRNLATATNATSAGEAAYGTLIAGPPGSLRAALYWYNVDTGAGQPACSLTSLGTCNTSMRWLALNAAAETFLAVPSFASPVGLSATPNDLTRTWTRYSAPGDYMTGASYRRSPNANGSPTDAGFVMPWTEFTSPKEIHTRQRNIGSYYSSETHAFDPGDARWYTDDGDWAPGQYKGECSSPSFVFGLSAATSTARAHSIICTHQLVPMLMSGGSTLDFSNGSQSRDTLPDWDVGFYKGECGPNEAVTGVGRMPDGRLDRVRCTPMGGGFHRTTCTARILSSGDNRGTTVFGDWAPTYYKGECAGNEFVKGVSASVYNGSAHAIQCCSLSVQ